MISLGCTDLYRIGPGSGGHPKPAEGLISVCTVSSRCSHDPLRIICDNSASEQELEVGLAPDAHLRHRPAPATERDPARDGDPMGQAVGGGGAATGSRSHVWGVVDRCMGVDRRATSRPPRGAGFGPSGPLRSGRDRRVAPSSVDTGRATFPGTAPGFARVGRGHGGRQPALGGLRAGARRGARPGCVRSSRPWGRGITTPPFASRGSRPGGGHLVRHAEHWRDRRRGTSLPETAPSRWTRT